MEIALKIDVDTHRGLQLGVPRLARELEREAVAASFYISMGPDNSGKAIRRAFTNRGFVKKILRTRAAGMYGLRTILSGTILPARPIALAFPSIVRDLDHRGFEVGIHGYDHVRWQDRIDQLGENGLRAEVEDACEVFRAMFRRPAAAFAAPGWRVNPTALKLLDRAGLLYWSNTRGRCPFRCRAANGTLRTPEIPTTLPTLDEVMGRPELADSSALVRFYLDRMSPERLNVHTIHAESEGIGHFGVFTELLRALKERGFSFVRLDTVAARLKNAELPACDLLRIELEGRAGWISAQGPEQDPAVNREPNAPTAALTAR